MWAKFSTNASILLVGILTSTKNNFTLFLIKYFLPHRYLVGLNFR